MAKAVAIKTQVLEPVAVTPTSMLDRAVSSGANVEVIEKLMGLQERWEQNQALKAYNSAIAAARAEIPVILKSNEKTGAGGSYKYEDLATIARIVDPILAKYGLSYRYKSESNGEVKVTCVISHADGHCEENSLTTKPDTSGSKNTVQALGSAVTYLQRYTLKLALGIATSKDDDVATSGASLPDVINNEQLAELRDLIAEVGADTDRFCAFLKIEGLGDLPAGRFAYAKHALEAKRAKK